MFRSFTIKNFRCFHDLTIEPLERVNLIAGMNGVGKTTLLEAMLIHLYPEDPNAPLAVNFHRGLKQIEDTEIWGWLFFDKRIDEIIKLTSLDEDSGRYSLQIRLVEPKEIQLIPPDYDETASSRLAGSLAMAVRPRELKLEYQNATGQTGEARAFVRNARIKFEYGSVASGSSAVFIPAHLYSEKGAPELFSKLEEENRQDEVLVTLQLLEPRLRRLTVLVTGGAPMIYGDIGIDRLVPVPLMGEGVLRLLVLVLTITSKRVVLIDEIERGFHYSLMGKVWQAIADAARRSETQIFATTHSWECIQAAHEAFTASGIYDFRLHRLERIDNEIRAVGYDQDMLATAIATGLEVR